MKCKDLEVGMLLKIASSDMTCWLSNVSRKTRGTEYEKSIRRFVLAESPIGILMGFQRGIISVDPSEPIIYAGRKKIKTQSGQNKTLRLLYVAGSVAYIEGRDFKHLQVA